ELEGVGNTYILNPWKIFGMNTIKYNPFCSLDAYSDTLYDDCCDFADAIYEPKDKQSDTGEHFDELARDFICTFLMYLTIKNYPEPPNPVDLLDEFVERTISAKELKAFVDEILGLVHPDAYTKRTLNQCAMAMLKLVSDGENKEFQGVCTTFIRAMKSFRGKTLAQSVIASKKESRDLLGLLFQGQYDKGNHDLYISFPQNRMERARTWLRLVLTSFIRDNMNRPPKNPVLFVLDEFPQLGSFNTIVKNAAYLRGFHVRFWFIGQNIGQLKSNYGDEGRQTIMENCTVRQFFNVTDETAKYVSEKMGKEQQIIKDPRTMEYRSTKESYVMTRTEVERTPDIINFIGNEPPILTKKVPYYELGVTYRRACPNPLIHGLEEFKKAENLNRFTYNIQKIHGSHEAHQEYRLRINAAYQKIEKAQNRLEEVEAMLEYKKMEKAEFDRCKALGMHTGEHYLMEWSEREKRIEKEFGTNSENREVV
ncbi:MAG: type IV secretory system conjugative DNA transfer family protein, partial [Bacteroidota bacterium]